MCSNLGIIFLFFFSFLFSADILKYFFTFFPSKQDLTFEDLTFEISNPVNLHEKVNSVFREK